VLAIACGVIPASRQMTARRRRPAGARYVLLSRCLCPSSLS